MKSNVNRILSVLVAVCIIFTGIIFVSAEDKSDDIVILFTGDAHCAVDDNAGYAGVAAYKSEMSSIYEYVSLVDAGDFAQGGTLGALSDGEYIVDIMNYIGYDVTAIGNHDFDYTVPRLS